MTALQRLPAASPDAPARPATEAPDPRPTITLDLAWIDRRGHAARDRRALPATPLTEAAVSCFARGTLLCGPHGPVAVEDLVPGDRVAVRGGGTARVDWIGAQSSAGAARHPRLLRVAARAFGAGGPEHDVLLGAHAHILLDSPRCRDLVGGPLVFAPLAAFEDGHAVTAVSPPGEVTVFGLACAGQEALLAAGLPVASCHPASAMGRSLTRTAPTDMANLFPQMAAAGFGPARIPYLTFGEAQALALAGG